ncbi:hypothetical protein [Floridanema aerugineum]|uniref:Uncharacterized protein n=1 Tax=Floridaenema aerugineum BLCC-F46 TaxID=3153654 RepID=A0ABV4XHW7_9CYAN
MTPQQKKAIKILTQYERLANKFELRLSSQKIAELNLLRDSGLIKITNLPARLHEEFPGEFRELTLDEIRSYEE